MYQVVRVNLMLTMSTTPCIPVPKHTQGTFLNTQYLEIGYEYLFPYLFTEDLEAKQLHRPLSCLSLVI